MQKIFLFLFLIFSFSSVYAQKISVLDLVGSVKKDLRLSSNLENTAFNNSLNYKLPYLRKIDLRLGTNGNLTKDTLDGGLINEDYLAIIISPNNWKEMKLQKAMQKAQTDVYAAEYQVLYNQAVYERYQVAAQLYFAQTLQAEYSELRKLLQEKEQILRLSLEQGVNVRFKDIMEVENDKVLLSNMLLEYQNTQNLQEERIRQFFNFDKNNKINIDYQDFINANSIDLIVKNLRKDSANMQHPMVVFRNYQALFSSAEAQLERQQNRQIFNFFQARYNFLNYDREVLKRFNPSNDIAFRIGLTVPLPANNNLKRAQSMLRQKEDEQIMVAAYLQQYRNADMQYAKVENSLKILRSAEQVRQESLITKALQSEKLLAQLTASEILDLKLNDFKAQLKMLEIRQDLTLEYLKFLEVTGVFIKQKEKDFLKN